MSAEADHPGRTSSRCEFESADEELRRLAVERMEPLPDEESLALLVPRLGDSSWRVRKAAVERVGVLADRDRVARALVAALADGENSGLRNAALEALIRCGSEALPALLEATRDSDTDVRKQAVDALAGIGDSGATDRLVELLEDPDANVRGAAADSLGVLGATPQATRLLDLAAADDEGLVRLSALRALARLEVALPTAPLARLAESGYLRASVYELLGHSEEPEAIEQLLKGLEAPTRSAREAAIGGLLRGLGRVGPDELDEHRRRIRVAARAGADLVAGLLERLPQAGLAQRLPLIQFLGLLELPESVLPILEAGRDELLLTTVRSTLAAMGDVAEATLAAAWPDLDRELRSVAVEVFGQTRGTDAEPVLLASLSDADPALRAAAARALGARDCRVAVGPLVDRLQGVGVGPVESAEIDALCDVIVELARSAPEAASFRLVAALAGAREEYRCAVARILGRLDRADEDGAIGKLMSDPSPRVRRAAVEAMVAQRGGGGAEILRAALADEAPEVRTAAAAALESSSAADAMGSIETLSADPAPMVRAAALRAAGRRIASKSSPEERPRVFALFSQRIDDDGVVAMAAADALAVVGGPDAAALAQQLLARTEPELVRSAISCVGCHGDSDQLRQLIPALSHESWAVRAEAVQVLAARRVTEAVPGILRRLEVEQDPFVREAVLTALRRLES